MPAVPAPDFFANWLGKLPPAQVQAMYLWAAENPRTNATDAIMDIVAPIATAEPE